jgi:hypothetical protein
VYFGDAILEQGQVSVAVEEPRLDAGDMRR